MRITTRQSIQFHGVVKAGLQRTIASVNAALLTTLAACGDVVRTVTTVPAPIRDTVHRRLEADARLLSTRLLPQTRAYHEIWVDGEKWRDEAAEPETPDPLYGERYLPRKFKVGLAVPEDNTIDVLTNDLAIVALFDGEQLAGYNFLLGGGHGMTHNSPNGIVGRMPGHYALFVGGDFAGTRLNQPFADKVPLAGIAEALDPLFALFAERRHVREGFGDFCHRLGIAALQEAAAGRQRGAA